MGTRSSADSRVDDTRVGSLDAQPRDKGFFTGRGVLTVGRGSVADTDGRTKFHTRG